MKKAFLVLILLCVLSNISFANPENIVTENWQHSTKEIFDQYGFKVEAVELYSGGTYPVFSLSPSIDKKKIYDYRFLSKVAEKNSFGDYKIICNDNFIEVYCDKVAQRVIMTKSDTGDKEYDNYDLKTAKQKAIALVMKDRKLTYNQANDDYSVEGKSYTVKLKCLGFDENGRYEIRISPSYYNLSVFHYCYVNLKNETVSVRP